MQSKSNDDGFINILDLDLNAFKEMFEKESSGTGSQNGSGSDLNSIKLNHSEILSLISEQIQEIDFRDEAGFTDDEYVMVAVLYNHYSKFCDDEQHTPLSKRKFTEKLRNIGVVVERKAHGLVVKIKKEFVNSHSFYSFHSSR